VLFPAACRICAETLFTANRVPIGEKCLASSEPSCRRFVRAASVPFLPQVAARIISFLLGAERLLCRLCRGNFCDFDLARSYGACNEELKKAILLPKFEEVTRLGNGLPAAWPKWWLARQLHLRRIWWRRHRCIRTGGGNADTIKPS
jgi:hypothetical protein